MSKLLFSDNKSFSRLFFFFCLIRVRVNFSADTLYYFIPVHYIPSVRIGVDYLAWTCFCWFCDPATSGDYTDSCHRTLTLIVTGIDEFGQYYIQKLHVLERSRKKNPYLTLKKFVFEQSNQIVCCIILVQSKCSISIQLALGFKLRSLILKHFNQPANKGTSTVDHWDPTS